VKCFLSVWLLTTAFFKKVRYAGKIFASLSAASIVADPITNFRSASAIGGIGLQDSSLLGGSALGTVDMSNFITNYFNGVAIANPSVTVAGTENWWDSPTGPIVVGTDPNRIAGVGASFVALNPFATSV
jgi:hypothetical protein